MGRHDHPQDKLLARTLDELDKAMRRRDVREAAGLVMKLPVDLRGSFLGPLGPLVRTALAQHRAKGAFHEVSFFAARIDAEPRLVTEGATAEEADEARWTLLLAALKAHDKPRAQRHLEALAARLSSRPLLAGALESLAVTGSVPPSLVAGLPASTSEPRPGHARTARSSGEPPAGLDEVAAAVVRLFAERRPEEAVQVIDDWSTRRPALASALAREALGPLGLELAASSTHGSLRWDLARAFARLAAAGDPEGATLPLRWLLARHSAARVTRDPVDAQALSTHAQLVQGLLGSPAYAPVIRAHLAGLEVPTRHLGEHVRALSKVVDGPDPDLETWGVLAERFRAAGEHEAIELAPAVLELLVPSFQRLVASPTPVADRLAALGLERADRLLHAMEVVVPPFERIALMRALEPWKTQPDYRRFHQETLADLLAQQERLEDAMQEMVDGLGLPPGPLPPMLTLGRKRIADYFEELSHRLTVTAAALAESVVDSRLPPSVVERLIRPYVAALAEPEEFADLLAELHATRRRKLYDEAEAAFLERFAKDAGLLARAWESLEGAPASLRRKVADRMASLPHEKWMISVDTGVFEAFDEARTAFPDVFEAHNQPGSATRRRRKAPATGTKAPAKQTKTKAKANETKASAGESSGQEGPPKRQVKKTRQPGPEGSQP
jgi:hypothetical protein